MTEKLNGFVCGGAPSDNDKKVIADFVAELGQKTRIPAMERQAEFKKELRMLLNRFSRESISNTPDFVLTDFLYNALMAFDQGVLDRKKWYKK
jgi:hypothetical protein